MILKIAAYELRYMLRSPQTVISFCIFLSLGFLALLAVRMGISAEFGTGGNDILNSSFLITASHIYLGIISVILIPAFIANAILKDADSKFDAVLFATPITKAGLLLGRFIGAFAAMSVVLISVPTGMLLSTFLLPLSPEELGPVNIGNYVIAYFMYLLPTLLVLSAVVFSVAAATRSLLYTYLSTLGLLLLYLVFTEDRQLNGLFLLLDPFLGQVFKAQTQYWTTAERNSAVMVLTGMALMNRLFWLSVAGIAFALAFRLFVFRRAARYKTSGTAEILTTVSGPDTNYDVKELFTVKSSWNKAALLRQFLLRTGFEFRSVIMTLPFVVLMVITVVMMLIGVSGRSAEYEATLLPLTRILIESTQDSLSLPLMVILIFYAAEIIWRERKSGFNKVLDSLPISNWIFVLSKLTALVCILLTTLMLAAGICVLVQITAGFEDIQPGLYLEQGLLYPVLQFICIAVLSVFVQVLARNRFLGMMIMLVYLLSSSFAKSFGFEHPLYLYAIKSITVPLSDMNGTGDFAAGGYWIRAYWLGIASLLLILTATLWPRGTLQPLKYRLKEFRVMRHAGFMVPGCLALVLTAGSGLHIFYNTNVLNTYENARDYELRQVAYEKSYRQYGQLPMPRVTEVIMNVDLFPEERKLLLHSTQLLENKTSKPIETVHVDIPEDIELSAISLDGSDPVSLDAEFNYCIFDLPEPLLPGEQLTLQFSGVVHKRGFTHSRPDTTLVTNGTFIQNLQISPYIGFNQDNVITDRNKRRKYGLDVLPRRKPLEQAGTDRQTNISRDSDYITFEATLSTSQGQTAITIGQLVEEWTENQRQYFKYRQTSPARNSYPVFSAVYKSSQTEFDGIPIKVFHHPDHVWNVERILESARDSLAYYTEMFGPYQYNQVRIVEVPAYNSFARSFPGTVAYSPDLGLITEPAGEGEIDLPYYITAHELAHQWWGHQIFPSDTQGDPLITETLAQYSALMVMEHRYGKDRIRRFLKYELDDYLRNRSRDAEGELPLYRVESQKYLYYRKGSLIMYSLKDYLGEDVVNKALRRFLKLRAFSTDPLPVSTDFVNILKEEAGADHLQMIEDFLEKITLFDLKITGVRTEQLPDKRYRISLELNVAEYYVDSLGNETEASLSVPVDIGLFMKSPSDKDFSVDDVLLMKKEQIGSGRSTVEFITDQLPLAAGIDPYHKLIDRNTDDNLYSLTVE